MKRTRRTVRPSGECLNPYHSAVARARPGAPRRDDRPGRDVEGGAPDDDDRAAGPRGPLRARDHASGQVYRNPTTALLYTHALARGEGRLAEGGPLAVDTGQFTGRSPQDKFVVDASRSGTASGGATSTSRSPRSTSTACARRSPTYLGGETSLYVVDAFAGADPAHRIGVRVITDAPVPRALREDDVHRPEPTRSSQRSRREALVLHAPGARGRPGGGRHAHAARSSSCIPAAPRC